MDKDQRRITTNYELYLLDDQYKNNSNLIKYIDQAQNFFNSKQYPNENYENMIRVTMNICNMAAKTKASKVCGTPIYLAFTADDQKVDCTGLRQFDEYNCNKLHMTSHNYQAALNGFVNGTEVTFIRWDDDDTSYKGIYKGGLVIEHIDLRNFAVANPYIQDIQNQEWVMFWEDYPLGAIKEMIEGKNEADKKAKIEKLTADVLVGNSEYKDLDALNNKQVTVYTRFFRIKNEVYFMSSTKSVDIYAFPHPLSRKVSKGIIKDAVKEYFKNINEDKLPEDSKVADYKIDYEDLVMCSTDVKKFSENNYSEIKENFSLYPFAVFRPLARNRSFYGTSDIDQMIPVQKAINFSYSMMLKCMENNAYSKILVKPNALKGQVITNEPSQVLTDFSEFTNQWGIKMAESQPLPNGLLDVADRMFAMTRTVYGFTDVMDGSLTNQDMSGYMLSQMIKQSNTSIEQIQKLFWSYYEDLAQIRLMYYKHYVDEAKYTYELSDAEVESQEQALSGLQERIDSGKGLDGFDGVPSGEIQKMLDRPISRTKVRSITNEELYGIHFDISIDALQGVLDSELVEQQTFDNLLLNGGIQNTDPDTLNMYLQASPNISQRVKTALKTIVENKKRSRITQLENQYNELLAKTQQIMEYAKGLKADNDQKQIFNENLTKEFTGKIDDSNKIIESLKNELAKYRGAQQGVGMTQGELKSNNSRGIAGSQLGAE